MLVMDEPILLDRSGSFSPHMPQNLLSLGFW
jgi:hypothetical protein